MPIPYSTFYTTQLAAYGTGATPGSGNGPAFITNVLVRNFLPFTLTGVFQDLVDATLTVVAGQKLVVQAQLAADNGTPALSGQVQMQIFQDSVAVGTPVIQSYDTNGTGSTLNWETEFAPAGGVHVYSLKALGTGDATSTVQSFHAQLLVAVYRF